MSFNSPLKNLSTLQRDGIPQGMKPSGPPVASLLGFMGLPLAFLALTLYVYLPHHDVQTLGLPMAQVGFVFLLARGLDALADPLIGALWDRVFQRGMREVLWISLVLAVLLCGCLWALLLPQEGCRWIMGALSGELAGGSSVCSPPLLLVWITVFLMGAGCLYSALTLAQQTWSARLGGGARVQSRLAAWRETFGLLGVVLASVLWQAAPLAWSAAVFSLLMTVAVLLWWCLPPMIHPQDVSDRAPPQEFRPDPLSPIAKRAWASGAKALLEPLTQASFRALLGVFLLNGTASAVAATLFVFYVDDNLQSHSLTANFLGLYFLSAAASCPVWLRVIEKKGLITTWKWGMGLSVLVFLGALGLGAGETSAFFAVCALTGVALGADLVVPSSLLVQVLADLGQSGQQEGRFLAWWQVVNKLNLALAAGLSLPLLSAWGYQPGVLTPTSVHALVLGYALVPCVMKAWAFVFFRYWGYARHRSTP